MEEHLRFTGKNPPLRHWDRFPNWQNTYEEEELPDQDETTLRPADNQATIDDDVSFTAGDAVLADGRSIPALLGVLSGEWEGIHVYPDPSQDVCWTLSFDVPSQRWKAMNEDWYLELDGVLRVPVGDTAVFPLRVSSRVPLQHTGQVL